MPTEPMAETRLDQELAAAAAAGHQGAWEELVDRHAQFVWDVVREQVDDPALAAEACVATWLRSADRLDELATSPVVTEWLRTAASDEACRARVAAAVGKAL